MKVSREDNCPICGDSIKSYDEVVLVDVVSNEGSETKQAHKICHDNLVKQFNI